MSARTTGRRPASTSRTMRVTHKCAKRGCETQVGMELFACSPHWHQLPSHAQAAIRNTASRHLLNPERRAAFQLADRAWETQWDV